MAGEIVHVEFMAEDVDRAQRFWSGLFGWKFGDSGMPEMDYRMAQTGPDSGAALYASDDRGHPKYYFATDDIDASSAQVRELGGTAADKIPVPTHGWFAVCGDSEGNEFHLWQADSSAAQEAAGLHVHDYRAVVLLDRPRACSGRVLFTRLRLVFTTPRGGQPVGSLTLCHR